MDKNLKIDLVETLIAAIATTQVVVTVDFDKEYGNVANWTRAQCGEYGTLIRGLDNAATALRELKEKLE